MLTTGKIHGMSLTIAATLATVVVFQTGPASADPLGFASPFNFGRSETVFAPAMRQLPKEADDGLTSDIPARLHRNIVGYPTREAPGTIVIDTPNTYLYYVLGGGKAIRYGIGVGREGFTWSGVKAIERKAEWPDWIPPTEMLQRQPYLPRFMAGGPGNPLGARAMYIGGTVYRIHGTNAPTTIGKQVSSGCIRMLNEDVIDLYARVNVGTKVVVMPMQPGRGPSVVQDQSVPATRSAAANVARAHGVLLSSLEGDQTEACHEQLTLVRRSQYAPQDRGRCAHGFDCCGGRRNQFTRRERSPSGRGQGRSANCLYWQQWADDPLSGNLIDNYM